MELATLAVIVPLLTGAAVTILTAWRGRGTPARLEQVHDLINGRVQQLIEQARQAGYHEGVAVTLRHLLDTQQYATRLEHP